MAAILQNIGAVLALWGIIWRAWDHKAFLPGPILGAALLLLIGGALI